MDYEYSNTETFNDIAKQFGTTINDLMTVNNIQPPYPEVNQVIETSGLLTGYIKVPEIQNGNESVENDGYDVIEEQQPKQRLYNNNWNGEIGFASQGKCWIRIGGVTYSFPCFPETYSDTHSAHFTQQTPMGRSEPFQIYQNSGPRVVSASFEMHVEMNHETPVRQLVAALQSAVYPLGQTRSNTIVPEVVFSIGASCFIRGIITDSVNCEWKGTILPYDPTIGNVNSNGQYSMCSLSFSVTECTGQPRTSQDVLNSYGRGFG
jgi:LysM repeat protein